MSAFGKHYSSMYSGSMVGTGAIVFAVMGYVISNMKPCEDGECRVELNSKLLAVIFGEPEESVIRAVLILCGPDAQSRTKKEEGKRLVKEGEFLYRVVNGMAYRTHSLSLRRREQNRLSQARFREKLKKEAEKLKKLADAAAAVSGKGKSRPLSGEAAYLRAEAEGASQEELDRLSEPKISGEESEEAVFGDGEESENADRADGASEKKRGKGDEQFW